MLEIVLICDKCGKRTTVDVATSHMGMPSYDKNITTAIAISQYRYERIDKNAPLLACEQCDKEFKKIKEKHIKETKNFFKKV